MRGTMQNMAAAMGALFASYGVLRADTFLSSEHTLDTERQMHTATVLQDGRVMLAGGTGYQGDTSRSEIYDPATGVWQRSGSLKMARRGHSATLLGNGQVLAAGGYDDYNVPLLTELYDPASGLWRDAGSITMARNRHTATLLSTGKVLIVGGTNTADGAGTTYPTRVEMYDSATGKWGTTTALGAGRADHTATLLRSGKVLITGGQSAAGYTATCLLYTPSAASWSGTGTMKSARGMHTATLLPDGRVLVAGGYNGAYLATTEIYDPAVGTWTSGPAMTAQRRSHTATLLPDGRVLIAGGVNSTAKPAAAEFYDASSNSITAGPSFTRPREQHTASLLTDGQVLLAGGIYYGPERTVEIYATPLMGVPRGDGTSTGSILLRGGVTRAGTGPTTGAGFVVARADSGPANPELGTSGVLVFSATFMGGAATFSREVTTLEPGVTYRLRAYGTNAVGTGYSTTGSFTTRTALQAWKLKYYGATDDTGIAADGADPYGTGIPNLMVFTFLGPGQSPITARPGMLPQPAWRDGRYGYVFTLPDGVSGMTVEAERSATPQGPWTAVPDADSGAGLRYELPPPGEPGASGFIRLKVTGS